MESFRNDKVLAKMTGGKIAILPFSPAQGDTAGTAGGGAGGGGAGKKKAPDLIGWKYSEEFSLLFGKLARFDMVERLQVEKVLEEQDIDPSKIDEKTALKIGRVLGATGVAVGTYAQDYMNIRLVNTDTGVLAWNTRALLDKPEHAKAQYRRIWAASIVSTIRDAVIGIRVVKRPPLVILPPITFSAPGARGQGAAKTQQPPAAPPTAQAQTPAAQAQPSSTQAKKPEGESIDLPGVVIVDFTNDSYAREAGLRRGDIIEKVEDTPIKDETDLIIATLDKKPGDKIALFIFRDEKLYRANIKMAPYSNY